MKKILLTILLAIFALPVTVSAASVPWNRTGTTISPWYLNDTLTIPSLGGSGVRCLQTDNVGLLSAALSACGSGSGGSGSGTMSTSTAWSPINYNFPTIATDILTVGYDGTGVATSTNEAEFYIDPIAKLAAFINGMKFGIGSTTPGTALGVVGDGFFTGLITASRFIATSTSANIFPYASTTALSTTNLFATKLSNLTGNGFVKTSGGDGTLSVDTTTYESGLTAGDALTRTGDDFDFDGGATPAGDLGGTWASPSVTDDSHAHTGASLSGIDVSSDTNLTAGDALTLTDDDIDFDGGATPAGDLGGTWANPSVDDDSHAHTGTSLSGIDISDDTNLASGNGATVNGDAVDFDCSDVTDSDADDGVTCTVEDIVVSLGASIVTGEITDDTILEADLDLSDTPNDEDILTSEGTGFEWHSGAELCVAITGSADLCDGSDDGSGGVGSVGNWFTGTSNFNQLANSTSTQIWFRGSPISLSASSTSIFDYASTTALTVFGAQYNPTLTSALILTGADGLMAEYAGAGCTNQVVEDISALGASTCVSIESEQLGDDDWGELTVTSGVVTVDDNVIESEHFGDDDWGEITIATNVATVDDNVIESEHLGDDDWGDITISSNAAAVEDDSHAHTGASLSGIDVSDDTNLTAGDNLTLTGDDIDLDTTLTNMVAATFSGLGTFGNILANGSTTLQNFTGVNATTTNATTTNLRVSNSINFGGVQGTTWASFCTSITGSSALCDGSDDGAGGAGAAFPFTTGTAMGQTANSTTTLIQFTAYPVSVAASSTIQGDGNVNFGASGASGFTYASSTASTTISHLETGSLYSDVNAGRINIFDMQVDSNCISGLVQSGSLNIAGSSTPPLTTYGECNGSGGVVNNRVGIATSSPWRTFSVSGSAAINGLTASAGTPNDLCINATTKEITENAALTCTVSSRKFKDDIKTLTVSALDLIKDIRPVSFEYKDNKERTRYGFIAEEVYDVNKMFGDGFDKEGNPNSIDQNAILSVTVKAVQELDEKVDTITGVKRSVEENYQWLLIALLFGIVGYQGLQIKKLKQ